MQKLFDFLMFGIIILFGSFLFKEEWESKDEEYY